jgi:hypothetical protein
MIAISDIEKAREICRKIAQSDEFLSWALRQNFTYCNGVKLSGIIEFPFHLPVKLYNQPKRLFRALIVGTYLNGLIRVNTAAISTIEDLVGSISHESMHYLGYKHPFFSTKQRPFSVPYAIGYFFKQEAKKYV